METALNSSVGSSDVLLGTDVGVFLGKEEGRARVVFGFRPKGSETVDLMSKGRERLVRANMTVIGTGTGAEIVVYVVLFLNFMKY